MENKALKINMSASWLLLFGLMTTLVGTARAENIVFPADAGIADVKRDYGQ